MNGCGGSAHADPFIVAEVLAEVGLGTPPSKAERELIRQQFIDGMAELRRQLGQ